MAVGSEVMPLGADKVHCAPKGRCACPLHTSEDRELSLAPAALEWAQIWVLLHGSCC